MPKPWSQLHRKYILLEANHPTEQSSKQYIHFFSTFERTNWPSLSNIHRYTHLQGFCSHSDLYNCCMLRNRCVPHACIIVCKSSVLLLSSDPILSTVLYSLTNALRTYLLRSAARLRSSDTWDAILSRGRTFVFSTRRQGAICR